MKIKAVTDQEAIEQYEEAATQQPEEGFTPEVISASPEKVMFSSFQYDFATGTILVEEGEDIALPIHIALNREISHTEDIEGRKDGSDVRCVDVSYITGATTKDQAIQTIILKFTKTGKPGQYFDSDGWLHSKS